MRRGNETNIHRNRFCATDPLDHFVPDRLGGLHVAEAVTQRHDGARRGLADNPR